MSSIREQIDQAFRTARLERDEKTKIVIGMLKTKVLNEVKAKGDAEENDEMWLRCIAAYAKQLKKAMAQFEELGDRGAESLA